MHKLTPKKIPLAYGCHHTTRKPESPAVNTKSLDSKAIAEKLRALATDTNQRSMAARFRDVFDDVEATLAAGVSRMTVLETLTKVGINYTLKGFDSALSRNRRRNSKAPGKRARAAVPMADAIADPDERINHFKPSGSHNPADLDKIIANKPDLAALAKFAKRK